MEGLEERSVGSWSGVDRHRLRKLSAGEGWEFGLLLSRMSLVVPVSYSHSFHPSVVSSSWPDISISHLLTCSAASVSIRSDVLVVLVLHWFGIR